MSWGMEVCNKFFWEIAEMTSLRSHDSVKGKEPSQSFMDQEIGP